MAENTKKTVKDGKIIKEWRSVKVTGHVDEVLNTIKDLG